MSWVKGAIAVAGLWRFPVVTELPRHSYYSESSASVTTSSGKDKRMANRPSFYLIFVKRVTKTRFTDYLRSTLQTVPSLMRTMFIPDCKVD